MKRILYFVLLLVFVASDINAAVLATYNYSSSQGGPIEPSSAQFMLGYYDLDTGYIDDTKLFEDIIFSEADIGNIYTVTNNNDSEFSKFTSNLTNGINENIVGQFYANFYAGLVVEESCFVADGHNCENGSDLEGYVIDSISFQIDDLILGTSSELFATITVNGYSAIPEPPTLLLFLSGIVYIFGIKRNK